LIELAIFGSLVLMLLGALLNYGLTADYNQQLIMDTFRRVLGMASGGSASLTVIRDRYIPSPSHPYALGSVSPVIASAEVVRMHDSENPPSGQPVTTVDVNGTQRQFTVASPSNPCDAEVVSYDFLKAQCHQNSSFWCCSKLDQIFLQNGISRTGLQLGGVRQTQQATALDRAESASGVTTTSHLAWRDTISRDVVTIGNTSGTLTHSALTTTPKDENEQTTWTTPQ